MSFSLITGDPSIILALSAAISAVCACLVVCWPYLLADGLSGRVRQVEAECETIRVQERRKLQVANGLSLRPEPKKLFKDIFNRFNLAKHAVEDETAQRLRMAGYRGHAAVVTFVAMRLICPIAMFAVAALYIFVVLDLDYPFLLKLCGVMAAALLGYYMPAFYLKNRMTKRQKAIRRAWPDALDLLLICVESGMGVESAFRKVTDEITLQSPELGDELSVTTAELSYLSDRRKAYENLGLRTGLDGVKAVVTCLIQTEKYGTPLGQSLRVMAQENRDMRMHEAEKRAASLPPKLTVPMILFFLPVLFAVIITPAAIQIAGLR